MRVLRHWFNYRNADQRYRRRSSPLDDDNAPSWAPNLTDELLEIITVLHQPVALEPRQDDLLDRICRGPLISTTTLAAAGVLPVSASAHKLTAKTNTQPQSLF
ncbi:hypothetical protein Afe04nite_27330 [Asanoa ferruginea]|nr:hypothetical protein Afe04nite_27330 [Asanoa ferruginea]